MITLSNGYSLRYVVASGALAYDGKGWPWERPLVSLDLIKPELFTIFTKSLTLYPCEGNLRWWKPWTCVQLIQGGAVNKVGLTNPGIDWWCKRVAPTIDFSKYKIVVNIFGDKEKIVQMAQLLNDYDLVGIEVNVSRPNSGHPLERARNVIDSVTAVRKVSRHPIIVKVSVDQDYLTIAEGLKSIAEAISLNSVPWSTVFSDLQSPLWRLEQKVGGGGGGVSGKPAQSFNWVAVKKLAEQGALPVIGPSVMEFEDMATLRRLGASAVSFGTIFLRAPWKPTQFIEKEALLETNPCWTR
jgi:dihydroorotate dehydrogenase